MPVAGACLPSGWNVPVDESGFTRVASCRLNLPRPPACRRRVLAVSPAMSRIAEFDSVISASTTADRTRPAGESFRKWRRSRPIGEQRRQRDGAAGLDHELQFAECEGDRAARLPRRSPTTPWPTSVRLISKVISPGDCAISASQIEPLMRGVVLAPAARERAGVIVEARRLGGVELRLRRARLDGERDAGGEPAAGGVDEHDVGREPERRQILDDLAAGRALPGDHQRIVVGRHQHGAALLGDAARDRLAVLASRDRRARPRRRAPRCARAWRAARRTA